ncbi:MAG: NnrU family protein [Methylocella sp.]
MLILVLGIVVFLGVHSLTAFRETRTGLIERFGAGPFKGIYSLAALAGFALIVWGFSRYRAEGLIIMWTPPTWTRHLTIALMWFAFVALACINPAPGRIRGWLRHPMLVAVKVWALAHLLANGDAGGMLLFGSFLAWAVFDRIAVKKRGDMGARRIASFTRADAIALGAGTLAYLAVMVLHPVLFGVAVIGR